MSDDKEHEFGKFAEIYGGHTTLELIKAMARVRKIKDDMEAELSGVAKEYDYLTKIMIPERFMDEGVKNMNIDGIGRVGLRTDIYASIKAGAKEQAYTWISDVGAQDLIQEAIPPSTLKAFLKGRLKNGEDIPDGLFNVTPFQQATITKT